MKKLLSIGEAAKLKGISVKALRYYEQQGILKPAYINPQNLYRYYTPEQLIIIEAIFLCLELDIPLKNFHQYVDEHNRLKIKEVLADGKKIAAVKYKKVKESLLRLESLSQYEKESGLADRDGREFTRRLRARQVLTVPWNSAYTDIKAYLKATTEVYLLSLKLGLTAFYQQGLVYIAEEGAVKRYAFLEIAPTKKTDKRLLTLPAGQYACKIVADKDSEDAHNELLANMNSGQIKFLVEADYYNFVLDGSPPPIEFQVLK